MIAADANVLVRYLVVDDLAQSAKARALLDQAATFVMSTVLLEVAWLLRSTFGMTRLDVANGIQALCGLPTITLQEPDRVAQALAWTFDGMDFPDALHLAGALGCDAFVSFDRRLRKVATRLRLPRVREP